MFFLALNLCLLLILDFQVICKFNGHFDITEIKTKAKILRLSREYADGNYLSLRCLSL